MQTLQIKLPYPPSANKYWRRVGRRIIVSNEARIYKRKVAEIIKNDPSFGDSPIKIEVDVYFPDKRKRDLDNCIKILFDSLQMKKDSSNNILSKGLFNDDYQIQQYSARRAGILKGGEVWLTVQEMKK